jgi:hypothetical protein
MRRGRIARRVLASKIRSGRRAKKKKGDYDEEQGMRYQFECFVMKAKVNVESEPRGGEPASPVLAKKHTHSANKCEETDEENPKHVLFRPVRCVVGQGDDANGDEYPAYDCDGQGTFVHPSDA